MAKNKEEHEMKPITAILKATVETAGLFLILVFPVACIFMLIGLTAQMLSPLVTLCFVICFTKRTCRTSIGKGVLAITAILLYLLSWYLLTVVGAWQAQLVCAAGISLWFAAVWKEFTRLLEEAPRRWIAPFPAEA